MTERTIGKESGFLNGVKRVKTEIFTRAMGYIRPCNYFNKGKQSEFHERKYFTEDKAIASSERLDCK